MRGHRLLWLILVLGIAKGVRDRKHYDVLGVDSDADEGSIKRAYRKQAL